jgi:polysaccharide chain length determinant protein (PEP-CTERM system associated)
MTKVLLSRPNLERVIRMVDLDIEAETEEDFEKIVKKLRTAIEVKGTGTTNLYAIAARYTSPEDSKLIVQSLLSIFVEEIQGKAREESDQATRFLDTQVQAYEQRLSEAEKNLEAFKRKYIGQLPEEGATYYQDYQKTKTLLDNSKLKLQEALNKRDALRRQMQGDEPTYLGLGEKKMQVAEGNYSSRIKQLQQAKDKLLIKYTEQHPKVEAISRMLVELQKKQARKTSTIKPINTPLLLGDKLSPLQKSTFFQQLTVALGQAEAEAAAMQARVAEYSHRLTLLKKHMNSALDVETQLQGLNRDYLIVKKRYSDLLSRRETARLSERVEQTKVVKFRIVEPPSLPLKPIAPNRPLLTSIVLISGLLAGIGASILRSMIYPMISTVKQLATVTGKPVLGSVESIIMPGQQKKNIFSKVSFIAACFALLVSFGGVLLISKSALHETNDVSSLGRDDWEKKGL